MCQRAASSSGTAHEAVRTLCQKQPHQHGSGTWRQAPQGPRPLTSSTSQLNVVLPSMAAAGAPGTSTSQVSPSPSFFQLACPPAPPSAQQPSRAYLVVAQRHLISRHVNRDAAHRVGKRRLLNGHLHGQLPSRPSPAAARRNHWQYRRSGSGPATNPRATSGKGRRRRARGGRGHGRDKRGGSHGDDWCGWKSGGGERGGSKTLEEAVRDAWRRTRFTKQPQAGRRAGWGGGRSDLFGCDGDGGGAAGTRGLGGRARRAGCTPHRPSLSCGPAGASLDRR